MKKMKIILHQDGTQTIEVLGAKGPDCIRFTSELEKRLGTIIGERTIKQEYYESESESPERQFEKEL